MIGEQLNFHLVNQVIDDNLLLLEVFQCDHESCLLMEGRVDFTVLSFPELLVNKKVLNRQRL